jgi:galactose-1-phosphate uridylyltransferase
MPPLSTDAQLPVLPFGAEVKFRLLAVEVGLVVKGGELSQAQLDFAQGVAELCAAVGDQFRSSRDASAGDLIRAYYGPVPF